MDFECSCDILELLAMEWLRIAELLLGTLPTALCLGNETLLLLDSVVNFFSVRNMNDYRWFDFDKLS